MRASIEIWALLRQFRERRARTARSADPRNGDPAATRSSKHFPAQQIDVSCDIDRPYQRVLAADRQVHLNRKGSYHEKSCVAQNRDHLRRALFAAHKRTALSGIPVISIVEDDASVRVATDRLVLARGHVGHTVVQ